MATREGPDARERRREIQDIIKKKLYDNDIWLKIEIHKLNETKYCRRTWRETFKKYKEDKEQEQQMVARIKIEEIERIRKEMQS